MVLLLLLYNEASELSSGDWDVVELGDESEEDVEMGFVGLAVQGEVGSDRASIGTNAGIE